MIAAKAAMPAMPLPASAPSVCHVSVFEMAVFVKMKLAQPQRTVSKQTRPPTKPHCAGVLRACFLCSRL